MQQRNSIALVKFFSFGRSKKSPEQEYTPEPGYEDVYELDQNAEVGYQDDGYQQDYVQANAYDQSFQQNGYQPPTQQQGQDYIADPSYAPPNDQNGYGAPEDYNPQVDYAPQVDHDPQATYEQGGYEQNYGASDAAYSAPYEEGEQQVGEGFLTISAVKKSFKKRQVVRGVSLNLRRGEAVGLLGPNGAGKTTVFYMITGLIPADEGQIYIDGNDVTRLPMYRRSRLGIGYLPQEASIFRGLSVEENIRAVLELVEPNKRERENQLDALLDEFNITRLRKSPSIALSGGERRRVEIARALASRPSYMLLDEPFAGIDPIAIGDIRALVRHLTQRGIGVLITDHNVRETLELIDRAYIIYDGQVLTEGTPQDIVNNEDVRRVYLGDMFS